MPARLANAHLADLLALFPEERLIESVRELRGTEVPEPYRRLLVHEQHMTVTMEQFHGGPVSVEVLRRKHAGLHYCREILLRLAATGRVVQFGIVRIDFRWCDAAVQQQIVEEQTPLGRVLIQHNVLTRISPEAYFEVWPGPSLTQHFQLLALQPLYGRVATIFCNDEPAVELLEVSAPVEPRSVNSV
jgi:chorismate-pyruvate lyase